MASLEGWNFTIKLCPRVERKLQRPGTTAKSFLLGERLLFYPVRSS